MESKKVRKVIVVIVSLVLARGIFCDEGREELESVKYKLTYIKARDFVNSLPERIRKRKLQVVEESNSVFVRCSKEEKEELLEYVKLLDEGNRGEVIRLKYMDSDELVKYLPPSVKREEIIVTWNPNIILVLD